MGLPGAWHNELGSILVIDEIEAGTVTGTYETATGGCATGVFTVLGRTDVDSGGTTVGFAVSWLNEQSTCNSTTTWAGQYQPDSGVLVAMWLLVTHTAAGGQWMSTLVGEDIFTQDPPSADAQAHVAARKRHAHP